MKIAEWYAERTERDLSPECDYGVWWQDGKAFPRYRVSYVQLTGEVYALEGQTQEVVVLGVVPPDTKEIGPKYYATLDKLLDGWEYQCGKPGSLQWVRDRLERSDA